jgi:formate dehydrogenase major subunit
VVEVAGDRTLAASCCRRAAEGMKVSTTSERARTSQRLVLELLQSDLPEARHTRDNEVDQWSARLGVGLPRFPSRTPDEAPAADLSHPAIAVNLDACIQCTRCLRACRDEQANDVIGLALRGPQAKIVFDMDDALGASTCVACGECVQACPTGALSPARDAALQPVTKQVDSVCPYCGVGCQLTYHVADDGAPAPTAVSPSSAVATAEAQAEGIVFTPASPTDRIVFVEGRNGPANDGRLCVKGRYGLDYARHPQRLTAPLIRLPGAPKDPALALDPAVARAGFREVFVHSPRVEGIHLRHAPVARGGIRLSDRHDDLRTEVLDLASAAPVRRRFAFDDDDRALGEDPGAPHRTELVEQRLGQDRTGGASRTSRRGGKDQPAGFTGGSRRCSMATSAP